MCFSKRHRKGIFRGQSHAWVWQGCCACCMNQTPSDDVLYSNIYAQGREKGLEGAPGIIKLSSWLPQELHLNSQDEFSDRTRGDILTFPLLPSPMTLHTTWWPGCSAPCPCVRAAFSLCISLSEPLRLSCVPEKPLNSLAVWFSILKHWAVQGKKAIHLIAPAGTSVGLGLSTSWSAPDPFQNTSTDSFLEQTSLFTSFTSFTAYSTPRTLSSLISSLPHVWPFLSFTSLVTCTLLPQKSFALSDFCLPHPWWPFGCSTSSTAHKRSKKGIKRANPVTLIPTPPSLCFYCQMGFKGTRKVQAWAIIQIHLTSLLWITNRKTYEWLWAVPKNSLGVLQLALHLR